jgi:3-deoxy-7-phosphoheptulonate synthase
VFELGDDGLRYIRRAGDETGLPVVTEVVDVRLVDQVAKYADMLQVGARNMQNFPLLQEVERTGKPVLLKRNFGASLRDWLGAAEYVLYQGNDGVVLCERGIVAPPPRAGLALHRRSPGGPRDPGVLPPAGRGGFEPRDVPAALRGPDRARGDRRRGRRHPDRRAPTPEQAAVDPLQALDYRAFERLMSELRGIAQVVGRTL